MGGGMGMKTLQASQRAMAAQSSSPWRFVLPLLPSHTVLLGRMSWQNTVTQGHVDLIALTMSTAAASDSMAVLLNWLVSTNTASASNRRVFSRSFARSGEPRIYLSRSQQEHR